jgi:uncharacterized protein (DUF1697 family)
MNTYIAFLRAINVAGHAVVRMEDLKHTFVSAGCQGVRTFIQSGNVVFAAPDGNTPAIFKRVHVNLRKLIGREPVILYRTVREMERMMAAAPFRRFETEPRVKLYVSFLAEKPRGRPKFPLLSSKEALEVFALKNTEAFIVSRHKKNGFYGFPNNFIEEELGVQATTRNWSTITKMLAMLQKEPIGANCS